MFVVGSPASTFAFRCICFPLRSRPACSFLWCLGSIAFHTSRQYSFPQAPPFTYSKTEICGLYSMISFSVVELPFRGRSLSVLRAFILPFSCIHRPFSTRPSSVHRLYTVRSSVRFALAFEFNENGTGTLYDRYCT